MVEMEEGTAGMMARGGAVVVDFVVDRAMSPEKGAAVAEASSGLGRAADDDARVAEGGPALGGIEPLLAPFAIALLAAAVGTLPVALAKALAALGLNSPDPLFTVVVVVVVVDDDDDDDDPILELALALELLFDTPSPNADTAAVLTTTLLAFLAIAGSAAAVAADPFASIAPREGGSTRDAVAVSGAEGLNPPDAPVPCESESAEREGGAGEMAEDEETREEVESDEGRSGGCARTKECDESE